MSHLSYKVFLVTSKHQNSCFHQHAHVGLSSLLPYFKTGPHSCSLFNYVCHHRSTTPFVPFLSLQQDNGGVHTSRVCQTIDMLSLIHIQSIVWHLGLFKKCLMLDSHQPDAKLIFHIEWILGEIVIYFWELFVFD